MEQYDAIVVGAGHAGCEAALALARMGHSTLLLTLNLDSIALLPCNPAIGGTAKGHLVRELDALGGEMGRAIDETLIQSRMLNTGKGPAVHSLRAQADKRTYPLRMRRALENQPRLKIRQAEVMRVMVEHGAITGVETATGARILSRAVILCGGVYLKSRILIGDHSWLGGPQGLVAATGLTDSLIDSSLFGTVKGAFTGAENSQGYLEIADGGTLFLDEFNSVSLPMQVKLLRFLQNKTFQRVGSPKLYRSDVRIIAAMNERPAKLIEEGRMRADVYYRLAVAELEIPPLRERMDDVPLLVDFFLEKYAEDIPYEVRGIKPAALDDLMSRSWPGNIRMLENAVLRSMVQQGHGGMLERIAEGFEVGDDDVAPPEAAFPDRTKVPDPANAAALEERKAEDDLGLGGRSLEEAMKDYERRIISHALKETGGNIAAAAERLSMNRTTLNYKVKKLGIVRRVISPDN